MVVAFRDFSIDRSAAISFLHNFVDLLVNRRQKIFDIVRVNVHLKESVLQCCLGLLSCLTFSELFNCFSKDRLSRSEQFVEPMDIPKLLSDGRLEFFSLLPLCIADSIAPYNILLAVSELLNFIFLEFDGIVEPLNILGQ